MPFPYCYICGLRHRRDLACNSVTRNVNLYRSSGLIRTAEDGRIIYVSPQVPHTCGSMDSICPHCRAQFWSDENINCCHKGDIHFDTHVEVSVELQELLSNSHFMDHIRQYNTAMAMASVGHDAIILPGGPSSVILSGKAFHRMPGAFVPDDGWNASFAQIYLLDAEEAVQIRNGHHHNMLNPNVLSLLHSIMMRDNPWVRQFCRSATNAEPLSWRWDGEEISDAMVLGALIASPGSFRNIIVQVHNSMPRIISDLHRLYHPLAYPLLFPTGMTGWFLDMRSLNGDKVSRTDFLKYLIMRRSELSHIQRCGRLSLEFYCDAWASHEASLMEFHKRPQQQALYRSVTRAAFIDQLPHSDANDIGVPMRTILPASVVGSPRFYHTLFLNAMSLPRRFGKPDLFITMTANPNWEDIQQQIPANSHWMHHPDIVARVFMLKVASLIADIKDRQIFGEVAAIVWRIEWQKRGLPHLHLLVILRNHIRESEIDQFVCAEIPDPTNDAMLYALVSQCNIHKPCDGCRNAGCHRDGSCFRNFPKTMADSTTTAGDQFPIYRRRGLHVVNVKDHNGEMRTVTDDWVVPYSPFLTLRYRCHINIEIAAHIKTFKYLYKYVLKPPDSAAAVIDEIDTYLEGRMLSASEAVHRILGLRLHCEWPAVMCLDIHLPNHERIIFDPHLSHAELLEQVAVADTTLTAWFILNQLDRDARQYLYTEIPEHYTWNKTLKRWSKRSRNSIAVARVYAVSPRNTELYALRLLLNVVRGANSWQCLLNVDGWIHTTFHESCLARGLLSSDIQHISAFLEIAHNTTCASIMRHQFVNFILNVQVSEPVQFFDAVVEHLIDGDFCHRNVQLALASIDRELQNRHSSIAAFGFEPLDDDIIADADNDYEHDNNGEDYDTLYTQCTDEQRNAVDAILAAESGIFIVQGGAGTGKTLFVNCLASAYRNRRIKVMTVASSALAASLVTNGKTAHSALSIPVPVMEDSYCRWDPATRRHIRDVKVLIWDEMSMIHHSVADCVNHSFQDLHSNFTPFGGKVVVFVGDFKQLPPVVKHGRGEFATIRRCSWWSSASKFQFTKNFRALDNETFINELEQIGIGNIVELDIPNESKCVSESELISRVYGDNILHSDTDSSMILTLKVNDCTYINETVMNMIPGELFVAMATDTLPAECHILPEQVAGLPLGGNTCGTIKFTT